MGYFHKILDPKLSKKILKKMVDAIFEQSYQYDFIAVRGMSGAIIAGALSVRLGKPVVIIRKEGDDSHSYDKIEHHLNLDSKSYIIIDDGIAKGMTVGKIIIALDKYGCNCRGVYLYSQNDVYSPGVEIDAIVGSFKFLDLNHPNSDSFNIFDLDNEKEYIFKFD